MRLSYEDLVRLEDNCEQRTEQIALLEEQLKRNRFYTVDGVEGNASPDKSVKVITPSPSTGFGLCALPVKAAL